MKSFDKDSFLLLLKTVPEWLINKQIIYNNEPVRIDDISVSGDYIRLEKPNTYTGWILASSIEGRVVVDTDSYPEYAKPGSSGPFTVFHITRRLETLENRIGQPNSGQSKSLFDIVASLNRELFELRQKVEEIELNLKENK